MEKNIYEDIKELKDRIKKLETVFNTLSNQYDENILDDLEDIAGDVTSEAENLFIDIQSFIDFEKNKMKSLSMELCAGRHKTPAEDGAIFENEIENIRNLSGMRTIINDKLYRCDNLTLYVTGLSVALVEVIKYCSDNDINLTLMHYDKETDSYYKQTVVDYGNDWD